LGNLWLHFFDGVFQREVNCHARGHEHTRQRKVRWRVPGWGQAPE